MRDTLTYHEINQIVVAEFRSLMRCKEHLYLSVQDWVREIIADARKKHATTFYHQDKTFVYQCKHLYKHMLRQYTRVFGLYKPLTNPDAEVAITVRDYPGYDFSLISSIAVDAIMRSDRITYFADSVSRSIYHRMRKFGFSKGALIPFIRRQVRIVIGHERRHKIQRHLKVMQGEMMLHSDTGLYPLALENDANWWAWGFNEYFFGDQVMRV